MPGSDVHPAVATETAEPLARRPLIRRFYRPLSAFASVVATGVAGFSVLGDVGIVNALFWLIDPSSIELYFQTHDGPVTLVKAYAIVVLSTLVIASLWLGETVLSATFGGRIREEVVAMRTEHAIDELDDHVVVCGYGTFGRTVADRLRETGRRVVVVERQESQYQQALDDGVLAVEGDARRESALAAANVSRARTVVGAIDDSNANIQIALTAGQVAPHVRLVVRVGDEMYGSLARRAGADDVVIPEVASGERLTEDL